MGVSGPLSHHYSLPALENPSFLVYPNTVLLRPQGFVLAVPGQPESKVKVLTGFAVDFAGLKKMVLLCTHKMARERD